MKISRSMAIVLGVGLAAAALPYALGQATSSSADTHLQVKDSAAPELVVLDTDIGDDIDDAFALSLVLKSPEVMLLGITTGYGDTDLRAKLVRRYFGSLCRFDVNVIPGVPTPHNNVFTQAAYAGGIANQSCGVVSIHTSSMTDEAHLKKQREQEAAQWKADQARMMVVEAHLQQQRTAHDAAGFLLDLINDHPGQITLIAIGPLFNVQAAIERAPATFKKLNRVVIMGGSIDRGYDTGTDNKRPPDAEWNIKCDPAGLRALLGSGVPVYMMPLDSTQVRLSQHDLEKILAHGSPVTDQLALLYHQWVWGNGVQWTTPTLFDPVAVAYSIRPELCPATPMRIEVDDKGFTRRVDGPPNAQVCLKSDESGFRQLLLDRLTGDNAK
jgi:inosine-uridine nucleoside N-ribohydrolase